MSSFLKHRDSMVETPRGKLHWHRARHDGVPFRGSAIPMLKDEEFDELAEKTYDTEVRQFNTAIPADLIALQEIYDKWANNLASVFLHEKCFSEQAQGYIVLIGYTLGFMEVPTERVAGLSGQIANLRK